MSRIKYSELIDEQKRGLKTLVNYISKIDNDIHMLHERQKDFTIIVYGRTMTGKSTLMEILTHGNGQSIGKGAQRTTLDVRSYHWNGLKIYDVPGICSFDGAEDDKLAFETAKSADLILFLITDDAPQAGEAEALAQLKSLGKPVLGVINVKSAFDMNKQALSIKKMTKKLADTERLDSICEQFKNFSVNHNQDWSDIKFVYTHLNAAYLSQPERSNNDEIYKLSNFEAVEEFIIDKVRKDGKFLRMKTFIDVAAVPMQKIIGEIYRHSANTLLEAEVYYDKLNELYDWREDFLKRSQTRLDNLYKSLKSDVDDAIYNFAEYNYENENAGNAWEQRVKNLNLPERCQQLLKELADECERKRKDLSDRLTQELKFTFSNNSSTNIEMESTTPWAQYAALVLPNLLLFIPGIGWGARIAIGVGSAIFSFLFEDKQEKIRNAKAKMRDSLREGTYPLINDMHDKVIETFNNEILQKGVDDFGAMLSDMAYMLTNLGDTQSELAYKLNVKYGDLNLELFNQAVEYSQNAGFLTSVENVARIPGEQFLIVAKRGKMNTKTISSLLGEYLTIFILEEDDVINQVEKILGSQCEVFYLPLSNDENPEKAYYIVVNRNVQKTNLLMAQQLAKVPIIIK